MQFTTDVGLGLLERVGTINERHRHEATCGTLSRFDVSCCDCNGGTSSLIQTSLCAVCKVSIGINIHENSAGSGVDVSEPHHYLFGAAALGRHVTFDWRAPGVVQAMLWRASNLQAHICFCVRSHCQ
jgi:hypothetical protein